MKKIPFVLAIIVIFHSFDVMAEAGDIVVRLRATSVSPAERSDLGKQTDSVYGAGTAQTVYGSSDAKLEVDSNVIPEVDISYYFTKHVAAELILALGTRHDVAVSGSGGLLNERGLGSVNLLPPTLTLQWHFNPDQTFDPYLGAGLSFIRSMDNGASANTSVGNFPIRIDKNNWGVAIQAGFDVNLQDKWLLNFDVKKIWTDTDVKLNAPVLSPGYQKVDTLHLDPWVLSAGIGKRF